MTEPRHCTAPGGRSDDCLRCAVPKQSCSEHASTYVSSNSKAIRPSQRGRQSTREAEEEVSKSKIQVPGTHMPSAHCLLLMPMSDRKCDRLTRRQGLRPTVKKRHARHAFLRTSGRHVPAKTLTHMPSTAGRHMPGVSPTQHLSYCIRSHVGYKKPDSRLRTCPGQRARR